MEVVRFRENGFRTNNYLVIKGEKAILIDASEKVDEIENVLKEKNANLVAIFLTHSHFDHISTLDELIEKFDCKVYIEKKGLESLYDSNKNLSAFYGDRAFVIENKDNIIKIDKNSSIDINNFHIDVFLTPGHSSCSVCYGIEDCLFTGDTIFKVCIGRNDLWSSSPSEQQTSLIFLKNLKAYTCYYPGHGSQFSHELLEKVINDNLI